MCEMIAEVMHYSSQPSCRDEVLTSKGEFKIT